MSSKRELVSVLLLSGLLILSPVVSAVNPNDTTGQGHSTDPPREGVSLNSENGLSSTALTGDLTQSVSYSPNPKEQSFAPKGIYPVLVTVDVESTNPLTENKITNPGLTVEVSGSGVAIERVESLDDDYKSTSCVSKTSCSLSSSTPFFPNSQHSVLVYVNISATAPRNFEITATPSSGGNSENSATAQYAVKASGTNWDAKARAARQRALLAQNYARIYDSLVNYRPWNETYGAAMRDAFTTVVAEQAKSAALGQSRYVSTAADAADVYGMSTGEYSGGVVGELGRTVLALNQDLMTRIEADQVRQAGNVSEPLGRLETLYLKEAKAWENHNRTKALEYIQKQRAILVDSCADIGPYKNYPSYRYDQCLASEARSQQYAASGTMMTTFLEGVRDFAISEYERTTEYGLPAARDPKPAVNTNRSREELQQVFASINTGEYVTVEFTVSNGPNAGKTSKQGYLSVSYADSFDIVAVSEAGTQDESLRIRNRSRGETANGANGSTLSLAHPLTDIWERYEPGEQNVYRVTFEKTETGASWLAFRAAFQPALNDGTQSDFARYPRDDRFPTDQQGWHAINISGSASTSFQPPTATIGVSNTSVSTGETVSFDGTSSSAAGGVSTYQWDLDTDGDGTVERTVQGAAFDRDFDDPGLKNVTLTVKNSTGASSRTSVQINVDSTTQPNAGFYANRTVIEPGQPVTLTASGTGDSYQWDLDGDGSFTDGSGDTVVRTFSSTGDLTVSLRVSQNDEAATQSKTFQVENLSQRINEPVVRVDSLTEATESDLITLSANQSSDRAVVNGSVVPGTIDLYEWDLDGDGSVDATGREISHRFGSKGTKNITLTVTDNQSNSVNANLTVNISSSTSSNNSTISPKWRYDSIPKSAVAADEERVYVTNSSTQVLAYDLQTGVKEWEGNGSKFGDDLRVQSSNIFSLHTSGDWVDALASSNGSLRYRQKAARLTSLNDWTFTKQGNGAGFLVSYHARKTELKSFDTATGKTQWSKSGASELVGATESELIMFDPPSGRVYGISRANQSVLWEDYLRFSAGIGDGVVHNGTAYVWNSQGQFVAYDTATNQRKWKYRHFNSRVIVKPVESNDTVFVVFYDDRSDTSEVHAFNKSSGNQKWMKSYSNISTQKPHWKHYTLGILGPNLFVNDRVLDPVTGRSKATLPENFHTAISSGIITSNESVAYIPASRLPEEESFENVTAQFSVDDRFPTTNQDVRVNATNSTGATDVGYSWYLNGSKQSCTDAECSFTVQYPVNITLVVSDITGRQDRKSTVVRASEVRLQVSGNRVLEPGENKEQVRAEYDPSKIGHQVTNVEWKLQGDGTKRPTSETNVTLIEYSEEAETTLTLRVTIKDPETGISTTREVTRPFSVERLHADLPHYEFSGMNNLDSDFDFAFAQNQFEPYYLQLGQRVSKLPGTIELTILTPQSIDSQCHPDATGCAFPPNKVNIAGPATGLGGPTGVGGSYVIRHELVHISQYSMDAETGGDWEFITEGHAEFESHESNDNVIKLRAKPTLAELKDFDVKRVDYAQATSFVAAFFAKHGRQDFLELIRNSENKNLEQEFKAVTGESLQSFYDQWQPTTAAAGPNDIRMDDRASGDAIIPSKPMFVYRNGSLISLETGSIQTVSWDIDADGIYEKTGETVQWNPPSQGTYNIRIRYTNGNSSLAQTQSLRIGPDTGTDQNVSRPNTGGNGSGPAGPTGGGGGGSGSAELSINTISVQSGETVRIRDATGGASGSVKLSNSMHGSGIQVEGMSLQMLFGSSRFRIEMTTPSADGPTTVDGEGFDPIASFDASLIGAGAEDLDSIQLMIDVSTSQLPDDASVSDVEIYRKGTDGWEQVEKTPSSGSMMISPDGFGQFAIGVPETSESGESDTSTTSTAETTATPPQTATESAATNNTSTAEPESTERTNTITTADQQTEIVVPGLGIVQALIALVCAGIILRRRDS